ncbi:unnamed protein product [Urochloa humidicola]
MAAADAEREANTAFSNGQFSVAADLYTQAINGGPATAKLYAHRDAGDVSSLEELHDTQTVPHNATNGSWRTFPSSSLEESITTSPQMVPHNTSDGSRPSASSLGSDIWIRQSPYSFDVFYVRMDWSGTFWTYPNLGGPFQCMDEAEKAIHSFRKCEARIMHMNWKIF